MPFHRSLESPARPNAVPNVRTPIAPTTRSRTATLCASAASSPFWRNVVLSTEADWGCTAGVVERTNSWLHQFRRLRVRYERRAKIHQAFLTLGCIRICYRFLQNSFC
jgi:hypothetical protein